jgi:hypothetical protein
MHSGLLTGRLVRQGPRRVAEHHCAFVRCFPTVVLCARSARTRALCGEAHVYLVLFARNFARDVGATLESTELFRYRRRGSVHGCQARSGELVSCPPESVARGCKASTVWLVLCRARHGPPHPLCTSAAVQAILQPSRTRPACTALASLHPPVQVHVRWQNHPAVLGEERARGPQEGVAAGRAACSGAPQGARGPAHSRAQRTRGPSARTHFTAAAGGALMTSPWAQHAALQSVPPAPAAT